MKPKNIKVYKLDNVLNFGKYKGHSILYVCVVDFDYVEKLIMSQSNFCINFNGKEIEIVKKYLYEQKKSAQLDKYFESINMNRVKQAIPSLTLEKLLEDLPIKLN